MTIRLRKLLILICLISSASIGCRTKATYQVTLPPRFAETTCVPAVPAARANYPTQTWNAIQQAGPVLCSQPGRGGLQLSGVDFLATYNKVGGAEPNDRAFQILEFTAQERHTTNRCGDTPVPVIVRVVEYFRVPAQDLITYFFCCEEMTSANISATVAIVDVTDLPAGVAGQLPLIAPGENAVFVNQALTPAQLTQVLQAILDGRQINWTGRYEYDGCNPPPNSTTRCRQRHCLDLDWTDSNGRRAANYSG